MKNIILILFLLFISGGIKAQRLNDTIIKQPDGITIGYFNSYADTCLPSIFIGSELKILFPCYYAGDYKRVDITSATVEINRLEELLTEDFISKLGKCCASKRCPDTLHGYYIMIKSGDNADYQYLDIQYAKLNMCGSEELFEIIELMNKINIKYR